MRWALPFFAIQIPSSWKPWIRDGRSQRPVEPGMARISWKDASSYILFFAVCPTIQNGLPVSIHHEAASPEKVAKGCHVLHTKYRAKDCTPIGPRYRTDVTEMRENAVPSNAELLWLIFLVVPRWWKRGPNHAE